ncbi:MAG: hypothetical protein IPP69_17640 [Flavobacteriales bacterium]|nr:hypothetical protein [Flavobacteriales bacterium]
MENYKEQLNKLYLEAKENHGGGPNSKFEFLSSDIFDFTTYDGSIDELFAKNMIEVIDCILNKTTFEYHKSGQYGVKYLNFLTMVNTPFMKGKLEWGTSIRGAWFDEYGYPSEKEEDKFYSITSDWKIPKKEITEFMKQLLEWSKEE